MLHWFVLQYVFCVTYHKIHLNNYYRDSGSRMKSFPNFLLFMQAYLLGYLLIQMKAQILTKIYAVVHFIITAVIISYIQGDEEETNSSDVLRPKVI